MTPFVMVLAIIGVLILLALGFFASLFLLGAKVNLKSLPLAEGAAGDDFKVLSCENTPYLIENNLPYPTYFEESSQTRLSLNGTWKMRLDPDEIGEKEQWYDLESADAQWEEIEIPSTFNPAESDKTRYEGLAWFIRRFTPQETGDNEWLRFCSEGVLIRSRVWLNGQEVGVHNSGWTPFFIDFSSLIKKGEANTLVICSDNRHDYDTLPTRLGDHHVPGWHNYGGLIRDLYLESMPNWYVFKVAVDGKWDKDAGEFRVSVLTHNLSIADKADLTCTIKADSLTAPLIETCEIGSDENRIGGKVFTFSIQDPKIWSPQNPNLYEFQIKLVSGDIIHQVSLKSGFRRIAVDGENLLLNDEQIFLNGICKHEDHPVHGGSNPDELIEQDLQLIKEMGCNYIRTAHYPHRSHEMIRARDLGFLLGEEVPYYQQGTGFVPWYMDKITWRRFPVKTFGLRQLYNMKLLLNTQRELIEMVERDRNNPAIIIWGVANESYTLGRKAAEVYKWYYDIVKAFDSSRLVTMAEITYDIPQLDNRKEASAHMDIASYNIYIGWYYNQLENLEEHVERIYNKFPGKPLILSEFGGEAMPGRLEKDGYYEAERVMENRTYSEDYQAKLIEHYVSLGRRKPYIAGVSPWVFADFYCSQFPTNPIPYFNIKGVVSKDREPKQSYHLLKKIYQNG